MDEHKHLHAHQVQRIAVVGGGIAGMAAAIRMAVAGHQVSLFEASQTLGGKLTDTRLQDFRFDNGPSLFTLPELLEELFSLAGRRLSDYLAYERLELVCRYFYPDGTKIDAWSDSDRFALEIERTTQVPAAKTKAYLRRAAFIYETTTPVFLARSLHRFSNYLRWVALKGVLRIPWLGIFGSMHAFNKAWFGDRRVVQLFDRFATYNGSDPYQAPATLLQIAHIEHQEGAWYPEGGMVAIRDALQKLLLELGVLVYIGRTVDQLDVTGGKLTGLTIAGKQLPFDKVIFAGDIHQFYERLLPGSRPHKNPEKDELSTSAIIFHWGVKGVFPQLDLHNILFSADYAREFTALRAGIVPEEPTVYVYVSARKNNSDAPEGHENWFVMVNTPADTGQDWAAETGRLRLQLQERLGKLLGLPLSQHIVCEAVTTPPELAGRTGSKGGAIYGLASNNKWAAFLRHPNYSRTVSGLYFCGGSVHPGGGIPLCLYSARIVDELIHRA